MRELRQILREHRDGFTIPFNLYKPIFSDWHRNCDAT